MRLLDWSMAVSVPIYLVDGEMFSWYGPRLLNAVHYFQKLIATLSGIG
jgi:hypothetical protein